jgi:hypothetical protein
MLQSKYYLEEAKWCNEKYMPNFKDQIELSSLSSTIPVLILAALMAVGNEATKEAFEWASGMPDMVHACGEIGRLLNDISAFKVLGIYSCAMTAHFKLFLALEKQDLQFGGHGFLCIAR